MSSDFDAAVLDRMRSILMVYRYLWRTMSGEPYGWSHLAVDIKKYMEGEDAYFPANALENFVRGLPHKTRKKRAMGVRKYSLPKEDRIAGIIAFLTTPESKGYAMPREELLSPSDPLLPVQLAGALNGRSEIPPTLKMPALLTEFVATSKDGRWRRTLRLMETRYETVTMAQVAIVPVDRTAPELYSGWAVVSAEDNLLVFLHHLRSGDNLYYVSLAIDNAIYRTGVPQGLLLLEHDMPEDTLGLETEEDGDRMVAAVREALDERLLLFRRAYDTPPVEEK